MSGTTQELKKWADYTFFEDGKIYTILDEPITQDVFVPGQGSQKKLTARLTGVSKPVIFNNTSWKAIEKAYGSTYAKWKGKRVKAKIAGAVVAGRELTAVYFAPVE